MARRSRESLTIVPPSSPSGPPLPPARMPAAEAALWREVVESKPADWFGPDNLPLLVEYIRATVTSDSLARKIEAAMEGSPGALKLLLDMRDKEARRASILATKLRLTQQSKYGPRSAFTADKRAKGPRPWQPA